MVWIKQQSQGSQSVLPCTLSCQGLQVFYNSGRQHFSWEQEGNRKIWVKISYYHLIRLWRNDIMPVTCFVAITCIIHYVKEFMFRESISVFTLLKHVPTLLKHVPCPTAGRPPGFKCWDRQMLVYNHTHTEEVDIVQHLPAWPSDIVFFFLPMLFRGKVLMDWLLPKWPDILFNN